MRSLAYTMSKYGLLFATILGGAMCGVVGKLPPDPPVWPAQATAELVTTCNGYDAFNCPGMYIGHEIATIAYFDFASSRLRLNDEVSLSPDGTISIAYEQVYGKNVNATHMEVRLLFILSNSTTFQCVRSVYPGQLLPADFMKAAVYMGTQKCKGYDTCDKWLVDLPPFYANYTFLVKNDTMQQAYSNDGAVEIDYVNFRAQGIANSTVTAPDTDQPCPLAPHYDYRNLAHHLSVE